jgi:hypothetical protein
VTAARRVLRFERRGSPSKRAPSGADRAGEAPEDGGGPSGAMPPRRLRRITSAILAVGLTSSLVLFFVAAPPAGNPLGYEPRDTKKYIHDLQLYGGTANVLADEFRAWFASLWQGRNLAYTVAVLTVLLVLAVRFFATLPPLPDGDGETEVDGSPRAGSGRAPPKSGPNPDGRE